MRKRAFLIHGWGGYPEEGWRPWLQRELKKRGYSVTAPAMPDTQHPRMRAWVDFLKNIVGAPDGGCIFVGHSLGCITILQYLEELPPEQSVGGAVLVASFFEDLGEAYAELRSFVDYPVDWNVVRARCRRFAVIHSDDDIVVPVPFAERLARNLGCLLTVVHGYKHFSGDDGIKEAPPIREAIVDALR